MNLGTIISAVPWLRKAWRVMPGPLRIPVLFVAGAVGVWYAVSGRHRLTADEVPERGTPRETPATSEPPA